MFGNTMNFPFGKINVNILLFLIVSLLNTQFSSGTEELLRLAKCLIPRGIDHITRALLLQQCVSDKYGPNSENRCYKELGCFPMNAPWTTLFRPFPSPMPPEDIDTGITLYTRNFPNGQNITLWPNILLNGTDYNKDRVRTIFITHGFANNGRTQWLLDLKDVYLKAGDVNVFIVGWGDGAQMLNYLQAASNTRVVGAEVARFIKFLEKNGLDLSKVHLIGHSLGAHIMGYVGKAFNGTTKINRITGLDAAQPGFENQSPEVRLARTDATNVDAIHTDAIPFIPFLGFGMMQPIGNVDFYVNGGANQPGCLEFHPPNITNILELAQIPVEALMTWVGCPHGRAIDYFIWALKLKNCTMIGRQISPAEKLIKISSLGVLSVADPLLFAFSECNENICSPMGFNTFKVPARGLFAVYTSGDPPYCEQPINLGKDIGNVVGDIFGVFTDTLQQINPF